MGGWKSRSNMVDYRKVQKVELDGRSFGSKAEAQGYLYLKSLEQAGEIQNIRCQVKIELLPGARGERVDYYVDFVVFDVATGVDHYIEVKGFETDKWKMKKKLWKHFGPGLLKIYKVGWGKLALDEEITPKASDFVCSRCRQTQEQSSLFQAK